MKNVTTTWTNRPTPEQLQTCKHIWKKNVKRDARLLSSKKERRRRRNTAYTEHNWSFFTPFCVCATLHLQSKNMNKSLCPWKLSSSWSIRCHKIRNVFLLTFLFSLAEKRKEKRRKQHTAATMSFLLSAWRRWAIRPPVRRVWQSPWQLPSPSASRRSPGTAVARRCSGDSAQI